MRLDLTEIALTPGKRMSYELNEEPLGDISEEVISNAPIQGCLKFTNTHGLIYVKGSFKTEVKMMCGRCLEYFNVAIEREIEEVLPVTGETDDENFLDDLETPVFVNYVLDLSELLRQYILVEVPIKPLCNESCKGICIGCGANLNTEKCKCEDKTNNNPFADLLKDFNSN
ncbi:MAG: DUF177 domain-containing protein [Abditibacteriota bacterium]|nr:DUF177 domain-containing protein [Abditibacteriota bacterium]